MFCRGQWEYVWCNGCSYANGSGAAASCVAVDGSDLCNLTSIELGGGSSGDHADGGDEEGKGVHFGGWWLEVES
jgi:hypothetical protein